MNKVMPGNVQEAIHKLLHYGFQECTDVASRQNGTEYLYAFERPGDEQGVYYSCVTEEDLFALLALVETSVSS
jgi:hypothetical protein